MNAVVLTCRAIEDEISYVLKENGLSYPVILIDAGLHDYPTKLKGKVQETIDRICNVDYILLGYALCGNGTIGLRSENATIVLPQYHDCIAMLLGSDERYRENLGSEMGAYFCTRGWLEYLNPKKDYYDPMVPKMGHEKAYQTAKTIIANYKRFALIENEAYDRDAAFQKMKELADFFELKTHRMSGTLDILRRFLKGEWDDKFQVVPPGQEVLAAYQPPALDAALEQAVDEYVAKRTAELLK